MKKDYGQILVLPNNASSPRQKGRKASSTRLIEKSGTKNLPPMDALKSQTISSVGGKEENSMCNKISQKLDFIIRANDSWKFQWDILILLIAIFNSITIPLTLSFDEIQLFLSSNLFYVIFNGYISSFIFFMDIFLQMNTTYYDSDGQEIFNKGKIRLNYLFGMFSIDIVSSIPIEIILPGSYLRMFNILKIIRVFRLTTIINKMNAEEESKSVSLTNSFCINLNFSNIDVQDVLFGIQADTVHAFGGQFLVLHSQAERILDPAPRFRVRRAIPQDLQVLRQV